MGMALAIGWRANAEPGAEAAPMILTGDDSWFRLVIVGYQFPENVEGDGDSNWLMINGEVRLSGREWRFTDPCLDTFEVLSLADWLESFARGKGSERYCNFTEPNLQFELINPQTMRVSFALESAPPWASQNDDWSKYGFNFAVDPTLLIAASELRHQLQHFPVRGARAGRRTQPTPT
jgi:hypothetical protein